MEPTANYYRNATPELPMHVTYRVYGGRGSPGMGFTYIANFFSILLVYRGQVQTSVKGKPLVLNAGDMRIFLKDDLHHFRCIAPDTRYVQISLNSELLDFPKNQYFYKRFTQPLKEGTLDCPRLLRSGDPGYDTIYNLMDRLDYTREGQESYNAELFSIAISLCTALLPYCTTGQSISYPAEDAIRTCLRYMIDHSAEKISLEEMANLVHLHPNYLCSVFKNYTGKTIFEHLTAQRLRRASRKLRSTRLSVQQIAEITGFPSVSFFARKFRSAYGCSPTQYRKEYGPSYPEMEEEG
jgi:AraC-like DNA-binding protein